MNRTDRLLAIILELQGKGTRRAEDLAATFEVTKRTIYRDLQALSEAGVPIAAEAGKGYWIIEGYFLPPVNLTGDEAIMLILGADFVAQNFDRQYREAAHMASNKIEAALSPKLKKEIRSLKESIRFFSMSPLENPVLIERLKKVRRAILESRSITFRYHKRYGEAAGEPTSREVDPYVLTYISGNWLLGGYDHGRKALRMFRLGRMEQVEVASSSFARPKGFSMKQFGYDEHPRVKATLLFDLSVARWVLESRPYYLTRHRKSAKGLLATLTVNRFDQVLPWLLSWGSAVTVLSPPALRQLHQQHAEAVIRAYQA